MNRIEVTEHLYKGGEHTPETRASNLIRFFGWQGGTIHQVSEETGISVSDLLYKDVPASRAELSWHDFESGAMCSETCTTAYRLERAKYWKGNLSFWLGVAQSRPLD